MSNILIIKHGSLGDIAQASGAIQDICENHKNDDVFLLTTKPYVDLFKKNPFLKDVILDKRLPRYNVIYLYFLMRELKKYNFSKVYDLQNSSRTSFYKRILFPKATKKYGHLLKLRYQKEPQKKILIMIQFYLGLIIN
jgi:ADP-heptose:LPS heptosyltransferase